MIRSFPACLLLLALFVVASCEPQLRIRNLSSNSLQALGYTRFDVVIGQARSYTNVIALSNGRATIYQALESDGSQWANRFTITASSNGTNLFTSNGLLLPENMRSMIQPGNRYVWDLTKTNELGLTLD